MKRQFHLYAAVLLFSAFPFSKLFSNNLSVSNLSYDLPTSTVTFDLSWDNGWHNSSSRPNNWDAAWVFVKFRDCLVPASINFTHGTISTALSDHVFNGTGGGGTSTYEPTRTDGTVGIDPSPNNTGVMLRNATNPIAGSFNARVTLKVTNLPSSGSIDIRVFGIEMVFVPQSEFLAGDGNPTTQQKSSQSFNQNPNVNPLNYTPYYITSENPQTIYDDGSFCPGGCSLSIDFPKGFKAYYIMKYEISQGLYVSFLNASSTLVQQNHYPNHNPVINGDWYWRHTIRDTGNAFLPFPFLCNLGSVSKDDRACSWLSWSDVTTFLDWAALRPLTELEYEKGCRGTLNSVYNEYAWGNTTFTYASSLSNLNSEDGTETVTTANANVNGNSGFSGGDNNGSSAGPLRNGIFATATSTRAQAGMGFYGAMELTGNVNEFYISVKSGISGGPSFTGVSLGDGYPDGSTGNHNVSNWPDASWPNTTCQCQYYIVPKGGSYPNFTSNYPVSYRQQNNTYYRSNDTGGRGGR